MCPRDKPLDLATFHQNRAAAYDQMEETDKVIIEYSIVEQKILIIVQVLSDCDTAINLNNKYVKALDRRAKTLRKQAMKVVVIDNNGVRWKHIAVQVENFEYQVEKLKQCLEDITSVCVLEGFQKQEHLVMVDSVLKELGRAEAGQ